MGSYFYVILAFICFSLSKAPRANRTITIVPHPECIVVNPENKSYDSNKVKFELNPYKYFTQENIAISIIHKGEERTAFCSKTNTIISCEYDNDSDIPYYGLIVLKNEEQTIFNFKTLCGVITQSIDLKFKRAYFTFNNNYFFIEVEGSTLQNGAFTDVDIYNPHITKYYETIKESFANCIYNDLILNCSNASLINKNIQLTQEKRFGSINWINSIDVHLIVKLKYDRKKVSNAEYVENKWTFYILDKDRTSSLIDYYYCYAGIVLIKQDGTEIFTISKCFINMDFDKCIVESDNQEQNDLIYSCDSGNLNIKDQLTVIMDLTYKKVYRLNNERIFRIEVEETSYRNGAKVAILCQDSSSRNKTVYCYYNDAILECSDSYDVKYLFLEGVKPNLIKSSSTAPTVNWKNLNLGKIEINIIRELEYISNKGLAYNGTFWNFQLEAKFNYIIDEDTQILVDIISNSLKVSRCTTHSTFSAGTIITFFCSIDLGEDVSSLAINKNMILGNTIWKNGIAGEDFYYFFLNTNLECISAYDLTFNNNKWEFTLETSRYPDMTKIIIDVLYGDESSTATCTKNSDNQKILCVVDKESQSKSTLVKIKKNKTSKSTITWNNLHEDKDIIMITELNVINFSEKVYNGEKWSFKIYLESSDLPLNTKVKVDLFYEDRESTATCILNDEAFFFCIPDEGNQSSEDNISINPTKKLGSATLTFINPNNNLQLKNYIPEANVNIEEKEEKKEEEEEKEEEKNKNGSILIIIFSILGSLAAIAGLILLFIYLRKKYFNKYNQLEKNSQNKETNTIQTFKERNFNG